MNIAALVRDLNWVREKSPLVHNITNAVVMNNTANALLALGASPVMAHAREEVAEMVGIASALVLNIGTLDAPRVESMLIAGAAAIKRGIPVVFDPVGAGATAYRTQVSQQIIETCKPTIIRGNASEIMVLAGAQVQTRGVDSIDAAETALAHAKALSKQTGAVVVVSGEIDYITDGECVRTVKNGHVLMPRVTGMGCTATAVVAAFAAVNADRLEAANHAMLIMGIAGEAAAQKSAGVGSMQMNFLDMLCNIDEAMIRKYIIMTEYRTGN